MRLDLHRVDYSDDYTSGYLKLDGQFQCYTLEDEVREIKVPGETCIPAGSYRVVLREVESPLTMRYRERYPWFKWHLMLVDVPGFEYVYIHIGNDDDDTDGCILVGESINMNGILGTSTNAFRKLYEKIYPILNAKTEPVTIYIH